MRKVIIILLTIAVILPQLYAETFAELYDLKNRTMYSTKGHPKAKGINLTLKFPSFWEKLEGERPNIVQKFQYYDDEVLVSSMLLIMSPIETNRSDKTLANEMFVKDNLEALLPDMYEYIDGDVTTYDNLKGCWVSCSFEQSAAGEIVTGYAYFQMFIYKKRLIMLNSTVTASDEESNVNQYLKFLPVFQIIGASIILPDQWK